MSSNYKLINAQVVTKCFKMCVLRKIAPNSILKFMVLKNQNGQRIGKMSNSQYFPVLDWFSLFFARFFWFLLYWFYVQFLVKPVGSVWFLKQYLNPNMTSWYVIRVPHENYFTKIQITTSKYWLIFFFFLVSKFYI